MLKNAIWLVLLACFNNVAKEDVLDVAKLKLFTTSTLEYLKSVYFYIESLLIDILKGREKLEN